MEFFVAAFEDGAPLACPQVQWELAGDDGQVRTGTAACPRENGFSLKASCDEPGFVRLTCTALGDDGTPDADFEVCVSGAGADVEDIRIQDASPEDSDVYWKNTEDAIAGFSPALLEKVPYTRGVFGEFACFAVKIPSPAERPVLGYLSVPGGKGPFPLIVSFRDCGSAEEPFFTPGTICFRANARGFDDFAPDTVRWQNVGFENLAALRFLKTLPEWDGKNITCLGSGQGALPAILCAAQDRDVTLLELSAPRCGRNGANISDLSYFVFQAEKVSCPVRIRAYLGDAACPPGTAMALWHGFKGKKTVEFIQGGAHASLPRESERFVLYRDPSGPGAAVLPGRYRHFKGREYQVLFTARHSETLEEMVVYRALYGTGGVWVRPAAMWQELVPVNGRLVYRFSFVSEE